MRISLLHVQFHEGNNLFPPLGLLYVAGALRDAGHRVHATAESASTLHDLPADIFVRGEGEATTVEIAGRLASGQSLDGILGTVTGAGRAPDRPPREDLDSLPLPARDLLDFERYLSAPGLIRGRASARHASVMAGRGCRYRCTFCANHLQLRRDLRLLAEGGRIDDTVEVWFAADPAAVTAWRPASGHFGRSQPSRWTPQPSSSSASSASETSLPTSVSAWTR